MTPAAAILALHQAIPSFPIDAEWEVENLSYLIFNDFARFICSEAQVLQYVASEKEARRLSSLSDCMTFLERALEEGDSAVRDLVDDCVETLSSCPWRKQIEKWAPPKIIEMLRHRQ